MLETLRFEDKSSNFYDDAYGLRFLRDGSSILVFKPEFVFMILLGVSDPNVNVPRLEL